MMKTAHPTTIPIIIDALSPEGDSVGNGVGEGDSVGSNEYSQLHGIEEESLELNHSPL